MAKSSSVPVFIAAGLAVTLSPVLGDTWAFRPGLWDVTTIAGPPAPSPDMSPEQLARLKAYSETHPPRSSTTQFCISADAPAPKSMFDPANQPPGACVEKILSQSATEREIEDDCQLPAISLPGATRTLPPIPAQARRHIILAGEGAGTIDRADFSGGGGSLVKQFRWLGAECGTVRP